MRTRCVSLLVLTVCAIASGTYIYRGVQAPRVDPVFLDVLATRFSRTVAGVETPVIVTRASPPDTCLVEGDGLPAIAQDFLSFVDTQFAVLGSVDHVTRITECPAEADIFLFSFNPSRSIDPALFDRVGSLLSNPATESAWGFVDFIADPEDPSMIIAVAGLRDAGGIAIEKPLAIQEVFHALTLGPDYPTDDGFLSLLDEPAAAQVGSATGDATSFDGFLKNNPLGLCQSDVTFLHLLSAIYNEKDSPLFLPEFETFYQKKARQISQQVRATRANAESAPFLDLTCWH